MHACVASFGKRFQRFLFVAELFRHPAMRPYPIVVMIKGRSTHMRLSMAVNGGNLRVSNVRSHAACTS
jgi:hypothetical protein